MSAAPQIVTKSEAAAILGVSRPCFSQYLVEGKVDGPAIVGSGHRARIDVDIAREQLRKRLEPIRFLGGQGKAKVTGSAAAKTNPLRAVPSANNDDADLINRRCIEDDIKTERLAQLALGNAKLREEAAARSGKFVLAEDVQQEIGRAASRILTLVESSLADFANAIMRDGAASQRDVLRTLRAAWREARLRAAKTNREAASVLPELVESEGGHDAPMQH